MVLWITQALKRQPSRCQRDSHLPRQALGWEMVTARGRVPGKYLRTPLPQLYHNSKLVEELPIHLAIQIWWRTYLRNLKACRTQLRAKHLLSHRTSRVLNWFIKTHTCKTNSVTPSPQLDIIKHRKLWQRLNIAPLMIITWLTTCSMTLREPKISIRSYF